MAISLLEGWREDMIANKKLRKQELLDKINNILDKSHCNIDAEELIAKCRNTIQDKAEYCDDFSTPWHDDRYNDGDDGGCDFTFDDEIELSDNLVAYLEGSGRAYLSSGSPATYDYPGDPDEISWSVSKATLYIENEEGETQAEFEISDLLD